MEVKKTHRSEEVCTWKATQLVSFGEMESLVEWMNTLYNKKIKKKYTYIRLG
jgi:abortive infection bacteriophage resistance protein